MYKKYLYKKFINPQIGFGVFTKINIPNQTLILEISGDIKSDRKSLIDNPRYLQISEKNHLTTSGEIDDFINHSCNPTCYLHIVGNRASLYSLHPIVQDQELTFDYSISCTLNKNEWSMQCLCQAQNCRQIIYGLHNEK